MFQSNEDGMQARHSHLQSVMQVGEDLIKAGNLGADKIQERINEINGQWDNLIDLAAYRKKRLLEAVDFYQVFLFLTYMYRSFFFDHVSFPWRS